MVTTSAEDDSGVMEDDSSGAWLVCSVASVVVPSFPVVDSSAPVVEASVPVVTFSVVDSTGDPVLLVDEPSVVTWAVVVVSQSSSLLLLLLSEHDNLTTVKLVIFKELSFLNLREQLKHNIMQS